MNKVNGGSNDQASTFLKLLKWVGRILGFLASSFFLLFFIGEGLSQFKGDGIDKALLVFLLLMFVAIAGYIISIFNQKIGGIMQIAGGLAMSIYHIVTGGMKDLNMAILFGLPYIICGLIFLIPQFVKVKTA